jgi:NTP pyrophosphatase (non-canonical NTP hydrolase)
MQIEEIQKRVLEFENKWAELKNIEFTPELTALHLMEEVGELSSELFYKKAKPNKFNEENLKGEVIDIILTSLCLADKLNLNLNEEINKKLEKLKQRDYSKV